MNAHKNQKNNEREKASEKKRVKTGKHCTRSNLKKKRASSEVYVRT